MVVTLLLQPMYLNWIIIITQPPSLPFAFIFDVVRSIGFHKYMVYIHIPVAYKRSPLPYKCDLNLDPLHLTAGQQWSFCCLMFAFSRLLCSWNYTAISDKLFPLIHVHLRIFFYVFSTVHCPDDPELISLPAERHFFSKFWIMIV